MHQQYGLAVEAYAAWVAEQGAAGQLAKPLAEHKVAVAMH